MSIWVVMFPREGYKMRYVDFWKLLHFVNKRSAKLEPKSDKILLSKSIFYFPETQIAIPM